MKTPRGKIEKIEKYTLRVYDGGENHWVDCLVNVSYEEALEQWNENTKCGTQNIKYKDGSYYDIFPANTKMLY